MRDWAMLACWTKSLFPFSVMQQVKYYNLLYMAYVQETLDW